MNAATIFKTLTTVTLSITLLITGGCNNMEAKKEETGKNTAIENIFARKSVRTYTPQPIEKEKVDLLVKAAMAAPTAVNKQPWAFVVVDDRKVLDKLAAELPYAKMTAQAPLAIVVCGDLSKALNGETIGTGCWTALPHPKICCWQQNQWGWERYGLRSIRRTTALQRLGQSCLYQTISFLSI